MHEHPSVVALALSQVICVTVKLSIQPPVHVFGTPADICLAAQAPRDVVCQGLLILDGNVDVRLQDHKLNQRLFHIVRRVLIVKHGWCRGPRS